MYELSKLCCKFNKLTTSNLILKYRPQRLEKETHKYMDSYI